MNNVSIIGRIGQNPEVRETSGGKKVTTFSIAVENRFRDSGDPDWVSIEVWGATGEVVAKHKNQGDQVAITGRLTSSKWTDDDGTNRSRLYVTADTVDFLHNAANREEATV